MPLYCGNCENLCLSIDDAMAQESFKCPDDFGFYPHHTSCDKYWKCDNNVAELKTCGNGLAFDATDSKYLTENCDYLHNVDCGDRTQLEPPISTPHCERLYGIFADPAKCDVFWNCWSGEASRYQCSPGLAYDREARVCMWADQVPECKNEEVANGFACPAAGEISNAGSFSRHAHPEDCRKYYICLEGVAREYGCPIGTVFKIGDADGTGNCEDPEDVPGCKEEESQSQLLEESQKDFLEESQEKLLGEFQEDILEGSQVELLEEFQEELLEESLVKPQTELLEEFQEHLLEESQEEFMEESQEELLGES
ncbi:hypothetical protein RP20_CCG012984 [Aedes albopictus]|nr:hypothetical protein RP20_CCG012984 [Aedes albopictus]